MGGFHSVCCPLMAALMNSNTSFHPQAMGEYMSLCSVPEKYSYQCLLLVWVRVSNVRPCIVSDVCFYIIVQSDVLLPWSLYHYRFVWKKHCSLLLIKLKAAYPPLQLLLQYQCRLLMSNYLQSCTPVFDRMMFVSFQSDPSLCWPTDMGLFFTDLLFSSIGINLKQRFDCKCMNLRAFRKPHFILCDIT